MPPEVSSSTTSFFILSDPLQAGTIGENGVILPPALPLTSERLERHGLFLIEDGQTIFLWVGRDAVPQLVQDVFDLPSYDVLRGGKAGLSLFFSLSLSLMELLVDDSPPSQQPVL